MWLLKRNPMLRHIGWPGSLLVFPDQWHCHCHPSRNRWVIPCLQCYSSLVRVHIWKHEILQYHDSGHRQWCASDTLIRLRRDEISVAPPLFACDHMVFDLDPGVGIDILLLIFLQIIPFRFLCWPWVTLIFEPPTISHPIVLLELTELLFSHHNEIQVVIAEGTVVQVGCWLKKLGVIEWNGNALLGC